ncbi:MAG: PilZ domain-containing protein [Planctomycetota bacterium]
MQEKRQYVRFDAIGSCTIEEEGVKTGGLLVDLSLGGAQIQTGALVCEDQKVRMSLQLNDMPTSNVISARGTIVRAPGDRVGVRFDAVDNISGCRLEHWVGLKHEDPGRYDRELQTLRANGRIVAG